jgi:hypothetical protein
MLILLLLRLVLLALGWALPGFFLRALESWKAHADTKAIPRPDASLLEHYKPGTRFRWPQIWAKKLGPVFVELIPSAALIGIKMVRGSPLMLAVLGRSFFWHPPR